MTKEECLDIIKYTDSYARIVTLLRDCERYEYYPDGDNSKRIVYLYYGKMVGLIRDDNDISWDYHWLRTKLGIIRVYDEHTDIIKYLTNTKKIGFAVFGEWKPFYRRYFDTYKIRKLDKNG